MSLPKLEYWTETAHGLHKGALLLGALQRLTQPPQPSYLELGLQVVPTGLTSGLLTERGRVILDLNSGSLVYSPPMGEAEIAIELDGRSQAEVFTELFQTLMKSELAGVLSPRRGEDLFECVSRAITAKGSRYKPPKREILFDQEEIRIDPRAAKNSLLTLQTVYSGIARFLARQTGLKTALVVWPEHFDLSSLLFEGTEIDEGQPHLNFGFAPYSEGIEQPYLYAYAYPYPEHYSPPALPPGAVWHTQGWTGAVLPYEAIAAQPDSQGFVEESCVAIYQGLHALIKG